MRKTGDIMKGRMYGTIGAIMLISMVLMAMPSYALSAEDFNFSGTDPAGDISDPNVDLTDASVIAVGDTVYLTMNVSGQIMGNDGNYTYGFAFVDTSTNQQLLVSFSNGNASYTNNNGISKILYNIDDGKTLILQVPISAFDAFSSISIVTATAMDSNDNEDMIMLQYSYNSGGSSGGGGSNEETPDPTTETPTDTSISVKITEVKMSFEKTSDGQIHTIMHIKGTTSGVDHVALNTVFYYKNGTHDWGDWIVGPLEKPPVNPTGVTINEMYFNSTSGNWSTWELKLDVISPYSEQSYEHAIYVSNISKVRIYARAFADANETQWNQAYYEFTPSITGDETSFSYDSATSGSTGSSGGTGTSGGTGGDEGTNGDTGSGESTGSGGSTPGFEAMAAIIAISMASLLYYRRK